MKIKELKTGAVYKCYQKNDRLKYQYVLIGQIQDNKAEVQVLLDERDKVLDFTAYVDGGFHFAIKVADSLKEWKDGPKHLLPERYTDRIVEKEVIKEVPIRVKQYDETWVDRLYNWYRNDRDNKQFV